MRGRSGQKALVAVAAVGLMGLLLGPGCIEVCTKPVRVTPKAEVEITVIVPAKPVPSAEEKVRVQTAPPVVITSVPEQETVQPLVCATSTPTAAPPTKKPVVERTERAEVCPSAACATPERQQPLPPVSSPDP